MRAVWRKVRGSGRGRGRGRGREGSQALLHTWQAMAGDGRRRHTHNAKTVQARSAHPRPYLAAQGLGGARCHLAPSQIALKNR